MSGSKKSHGEAVGQDSFLDVLANLVGILIILVMVVGARAKEAMTIKRNKPVATAPVAVTDLGNAARAAKSAADEIEADFRRISAQMKTQEIEIAYRMNERDQTQLLVTAAEQAIADQRQRLDDSQRQAFDQHKELLAAESKIEELKRNIDYVANSEAETAIIEHLPTPMAKTVFGQEVHLRLHHGRVAYVPWDDFIARLKEEAPRKVDRLRDQPEYTDSIGPLGGFWMRYTLKRESRVLQGKMGAAVQQTVVLDKFVLLTETEEMGETMGEALRDDSQLNSVLVKHRPSATTVTVWTYPDSFNDFRQLKKALFDRGFVCAARPLPADHPIGGSPDGTRSAAQ